MFNIGDLIIYSAQGICQIDDICEKTYSGVSKSYYVLHPIRDIKLVISIPVDNEKVTMLELIQKEEAEEIIESFRFSGASWIDMNSQRNHTYYNIVKNGDRKEISKVINVLMREKVKIEGNGKKFFESDNKILTFAQSILFTELAMSLNTTTDEIHERINGFICENEK
ncbi:MAG: CarD family transcriptional regulator [Solirubrobacterales bacterium]